MKVLLDAVRMLVQRKSVFQYLESACIDHESGTDR
jgi:hypothetical protein